MVPSVSIGGASKHWNADKPHKNETLNIFDLGKVNWLRLAARKRDELIVAVAARVCLNEKTFHPQAWRSSQESRK